MKSSKAGVALLVMFGMAGRVGAAEPSAKPVPPDAAAKEPVAITRTTVIPCPTPEPAFDHTKIDRTLKERGPVFVKREDFQQVVELQRQRDDFACVSLNFRDHGIDPQARRLILRGGRG